MTNIFKVIGVLFALTVALDAQDTNRQANQLIRNRDYDGAIKLLTTALAVNEHNADLWSSLAQAHHIKGDYQLAIEANRKASRSSWTAPTAYYNEACALSILGQVDEANRALQAAIKAGFLDFDLMQSDPDLDKLRAAHPITMPPQNEYTDFKAHNGVELGYRVITPKGYDKQKTYPAVLLFGPGNGIHSADWSIQHLVGPGQSQQWIIVYPIAPDRGWMTHPSHHALNDMLDEIRKTFNIKSNKYHLAGYANGARAASTYAGMSREYFLSLTTLSAWHWERWDDGDLASGFDFPVQLVVAGNDEYGRRTNSRVKELASRNKRVDLIIVENDDYHLSSLHHGNFLKFITE